MVSIGKYFVSSNGRIKPTCESGKDNASQTDYQREWKKLYKKPYSFFTEEFQSNRDRKTAMSWREWGK